MSDHCPGCWTHFTSSEPLTGDEWNVKRKCAGIAQPAPATPDLAALREALDEAADYIEGTDGRHLTMPPLAEPFFGEWLARLRALVATTAAAPEPVSASEGLDVERLASLIHEEMNFRIGIPDLHPDRAAVDEPTCQLLAAHILAALSTTETPETEA